ncbi:alcohol dehydrogenase catalytic domain-containing protein [Pseudactinotalea sp. Z1732]|uniref:alcohol dehydrogenase catalytic domain-containing protein n=1 Tax=Micrococcales TaxID=85006 RepID=UPI003C7C8E1D
MRAVVYEAFGQMPAVREVPDLEPEPDAAVVSVEATGLCRSDWHGWAGHDRDIAVPHVPGHEFVGRVVATGAAVASVQVGQRIIAPFVCGCGVCPQCTDGQAQVCPDQTQPGFTHWGSFAEQVRVRHADFNAVVVPERLDPLALVGLGCRFATAFAGLHHRAQVRPGERLAVIGAGGVGLSAVMIGAALGAEVIAVDRAPAALTLARAAGAAHTVLAGTADPEGLAAQVRRFGPVQVSLEALGRAETTRAALLSLAPRGRHVQIGLFAEEPSLPVGAIIARELAFLGSHGMAAAQYGPMLGLVVAGTLRPADLVTRQITLDEVPRALARMDRDPAPGITVVRPTPTGDGDGSSTLTA